MILLLHLLLYKIFEDSSMSNLSIITINYIIITLHSIYALCSNRSDIKRSKFF